MIGLHQTAEVCGEVLACLLRSGPRLELFDGNAPRRLRAALLARDLVDAPIERPAKQEILATDRQHLGRLQRAEQPVGQLDVEISQALGKAAALAIVVIPFDEAKILRRCFVARLDVGLDARAGQPVECVFNPLIDDAARVPVRGDQQIVRRDPDDLADGLATVLGVHQLRNAVDQDVLIEDRRQPLRRRMDFDDGVALTVAQRPHFRARRQRENRVCHGRHVGARRHVEGVEHEEVANGMAFRQEQSSHIESVASLAAPFK